MGCARSCKRAASRLAGTARNGKTTASRAVRRACPALLLVSALSLPARAEQCTVIDALDGFAATGAVPPAATCAPYVAADSGPATACFWTFDYRNAAASELARQVWRELTACRPGWEAGPEVPVNHPDSYSLRMWTTETATYGVSLKDKGALDQTLVILRRAARRPVSDQ